MGTAFTNIYAGSYYPAISIFRAATVSVNFGPSFKHPPNDFPDWQPVSVTSHLGRFRLPGRLREEAFGMVETNGWRQSVI
ncbi:unnamed protein product [Trichobilharzia regenti]|nr:unnamed protein product [Trichobilharzia regenti]